MADLNVHDIGGETQIKRQDEAADQTKVLGYKVEHKLGEAPQGNLERQVREHIQIGRQWEEEKE